MSQKSARAARRRQGVSRVRPVGMPDGYALRLAGPGDVEAVRSLASLAGIDVQAEVLDELRAGRLGDVARAAMEGRDPLLALAASMAGDGAGFSAATCTVLVVEDVERAVPVGLAYTLKPGQVLEHLERAGVGERGVMRAATYLTKLAALAVDPAHRGRGLGAVLLRQAQHLTDLGTAGPCLLYGQVEDEPTAAWYRARGWRVLAENGCIDLTWLVDTPARVETAQGQRIVMPAQAKVQITHR